MFSKSHFALVFSQQFPSTFVVAQESTKQKRVPEETRRRVMHHFVTECHCISSNPRSM